MYQMRYRPVHGLRRYCAAGLSISEKPLGVWKYSRLSSMNCRYSLNVNLLGSFEDRQTVESIVKIPLLGFCQ